MPSPTVVYEEEFIAWEELACNFKHPSDSRGGDQLKDRFNEYLRDEHLNEPAFNSLINFPGVSADDDSIVVVMDFNGKPIGRASYHVEMPLRDYGDMLRNDQFRGMLRGQTRWDEKIYGVFLGEIMPRLCNTSNRISCVQKS